MTNITVLKDESLGGIEREYREVKRKAEVGELVKMYDYAHGLNGEILKVRASKGGAEQFEGKRDGHGSPQYIHGRGNGGYVYTTLEPTDIIRINGERFRMVDRKATVGERLIVVSMNGSNSTNGRYYKTGDIAKVIHVSLDNSRSVVADLSENADYYGGGTWNIDHIDYRVLEPVGSAETESTLEPLSAKPAHDQAAEIIAKLTGRVSALEKRVAALETPAPLISKESVETFAKATQKTAVTVAEVSADLAQRAKEARQRKRDDIVKRAKEDVEDLREIGELQRRKLPYLNPLYDDYFRIEFVVNPDKRTVVALLRPKYGDLFYLETGTFRVIKGIAKYAPGDVFNSHIGRAIALRRALGLEVPAEYFEAPNPTEVRVGDVVRISGNGNGTDLGYHHFDIGDVGRVNWYKAAECYADIAGVRTKEARRSTCGYGQGVKDDDYVIIDDSRESDSAEPRKEVA